MKNPLKVVWIVLGFLCLGTWYDRNCTSYPANRSVLYGNTVLLCKKSSKKLHDWFVGTNLYKKHLDSFVQKKSHDNREQNARLSNGNGSHGNRLYPA